MVSFAGWEMPLQYGRVLEEHMAVRNAAGLFDVSHMGLVCIRSGDVEKTQAFLNKMVPRDLSTLTPGKAVYTQLLNEQGTMLDDIILYRLPETLSPAFSNHWSEFLAVFNASNSDGDIAWLRRHAPEDITLEPFSDRYSLIALQGPAFKDILATLGYDATQLPKRFHVGEGSLKTDGDVIPVLLARTGYTGEDGVEIVVNNDQAPLLWEALLDKGAPLGLVPVGLAARDTLRIEAAMPLYGHDISTNDTPLEADLAWSVHVDKAVDFMGKSVLARQQAEGLTKHFVCFTLRDKIIPRQHDMIYKDGTAIGEVTSGTISPCLDVPIGMGYVQTQTPPALGETLFLKGRRGQDVEAQVVARPFYKKPKKQA